MLKLFNREGVFDESTAVEPSTSSRSVDYGVADYPFVEKNVYTERAAVSLRYQYEIDEWMSTNQATVEGQNIPRPIFEFSESGFPGEMENLLDANYTKPTVIKSILWPVAMSGRDIISSSTGSGKTLGFLLPGIMHILRQPQRRPGEGPLLLCLLPTRELAQQVEEVVRDYCKAIKLSIACLFGGAAKGPQAGQLERGIDVCIATPGRLLDFLEVGTTNMMRCTYLVLDEADRMLDMGFEPQIRKIVSQIRSDRQTLMFSATWPKEVRNLAADFHKDAVFLNVEMFWLTPKVFNEFPYGRQKPHRLFEILIYIGQQEENKTLIFVETEQKAVDFTEIMLRGGWPALCIHGDKTESERDEVLNKFKQGKTPILLATDVAAGVLDVKNIKYVINYDYQNYKSKAHDLVEVLCEAKQTVCPELINFSCWGEERSMEEIARLKLPTWKLKKRALKLIEKVEVSADTRLFKFKLTDGHGLRFDQHIQLSAEIDEKFVVRPYTPRNCNDGPEFIELLVQVFFANTDPKFPEGGKMTQYLESMQLGDKIDFFFKLYNYPYVWSTRSPWLNLRLANMRVVYGGDGHLPCLRAKKLVSFGMISLFKNLHSEKSTAF